MTLNFKINNKKLAVNVAVGWYKGENWKLLGLTLLEWGLESLCIIDFFVLKLNLFIEIQFEEM